MALFGTLETVRRQAPHDPAFAAVFAYLDEVFAAGSAAATRLQSIAAGETRRFELSDGAFALEQAYHSKARADGFFESHRNYIDVQVVVEGEEWMEVADCACCEVRKPYQAERDLIVYEDVAGASLLRLQAGEAAIFYPADVHMPGLGRDSVGTLVRKTVIKVPVTRA